MEEKSPVVQRGGGGGSTRVGLCSHCGKDGAALTCTRCRGPLYCNRECQVRKTKNWKRDIMKWFITSATTFCALRSVLPQSTLLLYYLQHLPMAFTMHTKRLPLSEKSSSPLPPPPFFLLRSLLRVTFKKKSQTTPAPYAKWWHCAMHEYPHATKLALVASFWNVDFAMAIIMYLTLYHMSIFFPPSFLFPFWESKWLYEMGKGENKEILYITLCTQGS